MSTTVQRRQSGSLPPTIAWEGGLDGTLLLLDQTLLPKEVTQRRCVSAEDVWQAIKELCVRGAPAIGVAGAFGLVLGIRHAAAAERAQFDAEVERVAEYLNGSRPTAVNLSWGLKRLRGVLASQPDLSASQAAQRLLDEALEMMREDVETCRKIGEHGAKLIPDGGGVLTHCNAGALATVDYGTALSLMYVAHESGRKFKVFADETRPLLQGARLTAFELAAAGIDVTVLCDGAAASLLRSGQVQLVVVGADRIAANGDVANKIGTYGVALAAKAHGVPFYVAAPRSTFDLSLARGDLIPIEERDAREVQGVFGHAVTDHGQACFNPAFDVTPAELVAGIITEVGVVQPVTTENIRDIFSDGLELG